MISLSLSLSLSLLLSVSVSFNGHFPGEPGLAGVYWSKGWWRWWWQLYYCSYKLCKAPVKSSPPTNQHPVFYTPDALPVAQPTVSKHWREISWHDVRGKISKVDRASLESVGRCSSSIRTRDLLIASPAVPELLGHWVTLGTIGWGLMFGSNPDYGLYPGRYGLIGMIGQPYYYIFWFCFLYKIWMDRSVNSAYRLIFFTESRCWSCIAWYEVMEQWIND